MTGLRRATHDDTAAMDAFLAQYAATSMFLRSNLAAHGTDEHTHRHGTTFYLREDQNEITGIFGISNGGYLLAQAPDAPPEVWAAFAKMIEGREVAGMTGRPVQVAACLAATGLTLGPWAVLADEPLYLLTLTEMAELPGEVRPPIEADRALLEAWFTTYALDTGQAEPSDGPTEWARTRATAAIGSNDVVILEEDDAPVAMAGINARLPDIVQVGGVFTPDGMRGNGYARRATAGLLRQCAARGVTHGVLFAANASAAHAYEALGFQHVGEYRVAVLSTPRVVEVPE